MDNPKESFVLYTPLLEIVGEFSDQKLGKLFRAILKNRTQNYQGADLESDVKIAFNFVCNQFRLDDEKYKRTSERRSIAGKRSGEIRKQKGTKRTNVNFVEQNELTDTDKDNIKKNKKEIFTQEKFKEFSNKESLYKIVSNSVDLRSLNISYKQYIGILETIRDWSIGDNKKKTDWIATIRNWIKRDSEKFIKFETKDEAIIHYENTFNMLPDFLK